MLTKYCDAEYAVCWSDSEHCCRDVQRDGADIRMTVFVIKCLQTNADNVTLRNVHDAVRAILSDCCTKHTKRSKAASNNQNGCLVGSGRCRLAV